MLEATLSYGPLKKRHDYKVLDDGYDWYKISVKGKIVYVPKFVFES